MLGTDTCLRPRKKEPLETAVAKAGDHPGSVTPRVTMSSLLTLRMSATGAHVRTWHFIAHAVLDAVVRCPRRKRVEIVQGGGWIQPLGQRRAQTNIDGSETATELR